MIEQTYTLHPYHPRFAAGMAQMWNESDHQWPGTFTKGVPFDEPRILEWMERVAAIIKFVIEEDQTGKIVGYGDLWEETMRPGACYVALLNVHPDHQGHSLARRMLHEMVNWATEHGYDKLTIGTWPSNLKAMPLYKKVGFFWQPGTGVFMENYVPAVRQLPLAKTFFERHNWYRDYQRDLNQIEDEMRHPKTGDTKVYTLRWAADGDLLEAVFDRNGQRLDEVNRTVVAESAVTYGDALLPVLQSREVAVEEALTAHFGTLRSKRVRGAYDEAGWASGSQAADLARLASGDIGAAD